MARRGRRREYEQFDIGPVLEHYGADLPSKSGAWVTMRCPFHEDQHGSARVNLEEGAFSCLGCEAKGTAVTLVKQQEGLASYGEAEDLVREWAGKPKQRQGRRRSVPATSIW